MRLSLLLYILCLMASTAYSQLPGPPGPKGDRGEPGPKTNVFTCLHKPDLWHVAFFFLAINFDFVRSVGQKHFVSNKERGSFSKAEDFCSQRGLELALPQNEEENSMLTQLYERPLTFTKWGQGQPDRSIQETGCTMVTENAVCAWQCYCLTGSFIKESSGA
uniref:C-type lectin domain-containing protein n=1 Tax=Amphiprion percula TaxID=161767 RepID=A0A3P8SIF3_AMPPE